MLKRQKSRPKTEKQPTQNVSSAAAGRTRLFRLCALVLVPPLLLILLEAVLRVTGCGYRTGFFENIRAGDRRLVVNNDDFSLRFFPPELARWPGPVSLPAGKPADTYRIFILGESAARGEPEPPYSASRYLEELLRERFPAEKFEIVNVSITAINSHVILPIARDCAREQGDLWILYMGNNEMVGPFGAATVFGTQAPPLRLVRLSLALQRTRLGQLLVAAARRLKGKAANASWGGMKMFLGNQIRADDPRKETVYRNFEANLHDILEAGIGSGAKIILNTVAVNLKDCPPFASLSDAQLPMGQQSSSNELFTNGVTVEEQGRFADAAQMFEQAAKIDPLRPDIQFRWGECLLQMTNLPAAREHFQSACDSDALPFRADSRINGLIRQAGREWAGRGVTLFDAAEALSTNNTSGICGGELFYEHVHFNFDGQYRLGRAWAGQVELLLPAAVRSRAAGDWASQEICDRQLGLTDWNREAVIQAVIGRLHRPPMSGQFNNATRLSALEAEDKMLRHRVNRTVEKTARADFLAALERTPDDHWLRENYAQFLESCGDLQAATAQWQRVCDLLPHDCGAYYQAGRLLEQQDQWDQAQSSLSRAVALRPRLTEGWCELGNVHLAQRRYDLALAEYDRVRRLEPQNGTYWAFAGKALEKLGRHDEAIRNYRQALQLAPDFWETHLVLGQELAANNRLAEAQPEYEAAIRLQPASALSHLGLGAVLARQGRFDDALRQFQETLRLEPGNKAALENIARVEGWKNQRR